MTSKALIRESDDPPSFICPNGLTALSVLLLPIPQIPPCHFDADCVSLVRDAARRLGRPHQDIVSGAGHDAVNVAAVAPTAMIFIPCKDGISHNEIEDAAPKHVAGGADVLLHVILERANR